MIRWIEVDTSSYWDPNRFAPHVGLFEDLLCDDIVMLHSWGGDNVPNGFGFCVKKVDRVDLTKIRQRHILVREQYMFFVRDEINYNGLIRFLWDVQMFDKIVYLPYFREPLYKGTVHSDLWSEFQSFVCDNFEHEFYFDYNLHKKNNRITTLRRQISLDDLL